LPPALDWLALAEQCFADDYGSLRQGLLTSVFASVVGLERIFHEGMHQWDGPVEQALDEQARRVGKQVPRNLSHALIFFTAGEAIRRVVPEHVPYADKFGVWQRGMNTLKDVLTEVWKPYLDGRGTRDDAFGELIKRTGAEAKPE